MEQQVSIYSLLQSGLKRVDQSVRKVTDKADRV